MRLTDILKAACDGMSKHSPEILTGLGIAGFCATVMMVAKASPSADRIHKDAEDKRLDVAYEIDEDLIDPDDGKKTIRDSYIHEARQLAPLYAPAATVGVMSVACFLFANKIQADRQAAVMAAYSLSEKTLSTYQRKVIERLGEDAHREILDEATREIVRDDAPDGDEHLKLPVPEGMVRCYDNVTGRYFFSNKEKIIEAESTINKRLLNETRINLQEFYYELGLEERFMLGDSMGWDVSSPYYPQMMDIWFTPMLDDEKNPVLAINYHVAIFERQA